MRLPAELEEIHQKLLPNGCFLGLHWIPQNILADKKEKVLWGQSEKSAIACALINTPHGTPINIITKHTRICHDCHNVMALISKTEKRRIHVKDALQVHIFSDGRCICHDYYCSS